MPVRDLPDELSSWDRVQIRMLQSEDPAREACRALGRFAATEAVTLAGDDNAVMRSMPQPTCYCCGGTGELLFRDLRDTLFSAKGRWSLRRCNAADCGLLWLDPMPIEEDLELAYQAYYTHEVAQKSSAHRVARLLYRLATESVLALAGIPGERRRAEQMFLGDVIPGRLLDVGSGSGEFLSTMRKRGWAVMGVDVDPAAVRAARRAYGLEVHLGAVADLVAKGLQFDAITASHVIEHVRDPVGLLAQCRRLLRPGGRVVLRTPNARSHGLARYGAAWRGLEPPRHLHLFTAEALAACAARAGFAAADCFTSTAMADITWVASRLIARRGSYRESELASWERMEIQVLKPLMALRSKLAWLNDRRSGEEVCAILSSPQTA